MLVWKQEGAIWGRQEKQFSFNYQIIVPTETKDIIIQHGYYDYGILYLIRKYLQNDDKSKLIFIVLIALAIRLINFVGPVRGDDFRYLAAAHDLHFGSLNMGAWAGLDRVAIYYPISLIYRLLGISPATSILFPLLCSLATVILIFYIGKHLKDRATGIVAALLWAVFPLDVLNATQVLPDSIVSAFIAGAILMLLYGIQESGWKRWAYWLAMYLLIGASYFVKDASLVNAVFCTLVVLYTVFERSVSKTYGMLKASLGPAYTTGLLVAVLAVFIFLMWNKLLVFVRADPITLIGQSASDFYYAFFLGLAPFGYELEIASRVEIFDLLSIFFLVAFVSLIFMGEKRVWFPISWFGVYLMLSEWGTEKIAIPINYLPPDPELVLDRRHVLFVLIPPLIIVAMFLSKAFKTHVGGKIILLGAGLIFTSYSINHLVLSGGNIYLEENIYAAAIVAAVISPLFIVKRGGTEKKNGALFVIATLLLFGSLMPIGRYHSSSWQKEQALIRNLTRAADFLLEADTKAQIITIPGNNGRLDYASNYRLGYNWGSIDYVFPDARIVKLDRIKRDLQEFYVVFEDLGNESHLALIEQDWVKIAEFEEPGLSRVIVFHHPPNGKQY